MKLFANGCSFTWGGGILEEEHDIRISILDQPSHLVELREKSTWPWFLKEKLNATECVNYAIGCGSNDRIVRTTLDFFIDRKITHNDLEDWLVIIQFTTPERYEVFEDGKWLLIKSDVVIPSVSNERYDYLQRRIFEDIENYISKTFNQCVLLSSFLKENNIKYYFMHSGLPFNNLKDTHKIYLENNISWLARKIEDSLFLNFSDETFNSGHLNTKGHSEVSDKIYSYITYK